MGYKIKVNTPEQAIKIWYVSSIKKDGKTFSGVNHLEDAKMYKSKSSFQKLIDHFEVVKADYEIIEVN